MSNTRNSGGGRLRAGRTAQQVRLQQLISELARQTGRSERAIRGSVEKLILAQTCEGGAEQKDLSEGIGRLRTAVAAFTTQRENLLRASTGVWEAVAELRRGSAPMEHEAQSHFVAPDMDLAVWLKGLM